MRVLCGILSTLGAASALGCGLFDFSTPERGVGSGGDGGGAQPGGGHAGILSLPGGNAGAAGGPGTGGGRAGGPGINGAGMGNCPAADLPQDYLSLWLRADCGVRNAEEGGVEVWEDQSPQKGNAVQSIPADRPLLVTDTTGLPMIEFDGQDDYLTLPSGHFDFIAGLSYFAVVRALVEQRCPSMLQFSNGPEIDDIEIGRHDGGLLYEVRNDTVRGAPQMFVVGTLFVATVIHSPSGRAETRLNQQLMGTNEFLVPLAGNRSNNFVGRTLYPDCAASFRGRIAEVVLYEREVTDDEQAAIEGYLMAKWLR